MLGLAAALIACGSSPETKPVPGDGGAANGSGGSGGGFDGNTSTGPGAGGSGNGSSSSTGTGAPPPGGLADVGTLVVLGDSIGDGGGQGPYYYELLPDALSGHYGKAIDYRNRADSGSETSALLEQIQGLPGTLAGPVAVAITSGGNDMKDNLVPILIGQDGAARTQMGDNIDAALDALLQPDRFGAGVEVFVFFGTIYDASDGAGDYASGGCVINMNSPSPTDPFFESWNGEIVDRVAAQGQTVVDMHDSFYGHGYNNPPSWYASDCTHPNTLGHDQLHQLFFGLMTGG